MLIPDKHPCSGGMGMDFGRFRIADLDDFYKKEEWAQKGMYAFVCWKWVIPFVEWIGKRRVLEVMAGAGWLQSALHQKGVNIIATDDHSWSDRKGWKIIGDVKRMDAYNSISAYGRNTDILVISWPYMDSDGYEAIRHMHRKNPKALIVYIGEWSGCTGNEEFHDHLELVEDESFKKVSSAYETWPFLHDRIYLGRYKP